MKAASDKDASAEVFHRAHSDNEIVQETRFEERKCGERHQKKQRRRTRASSKEGKESLVREGRPRGSPQRDDTAQHEARPLTAVSSKRQG